MRCEGEETCCRCLTSCHGLFRVIAPYATDVSINGSELDALNEIQKMNALTQVQRASSCSFKRWLFYVQGKTSPESELTRVKVKTTCLQS